MNRKVIKMMHNRSPGLVDFLLASRRRFVQVHESRQYTLMMALSSSTAHLRVSRSSSLFNPLSNSSRRMDAVTRAEQTDTADDIPTGQG